MIHARSDDGADGIVRSASALYGGCGSVARLTPPPARYADCFSLRDVYLGQRSPIERIVLFLLFCVIFSVRDKASIKPPPSKSDYMY
jgi:hypothetical protein